MALVVLVRWASLLLLQMISNWNWQTLHFLKLHVPKGLDFSTCHINWIVNICTCPSVNFLVPWLLQQTLVPSFFFLSHSCPKYVVIGKKIPSQSNDKFVNYSQQTTIFHWNWKEILRFVGFITWLTQPIQPKFGGDFCRCTTGPPTNLNISF